MLEILSLLNVQELRIQLDFSGTLPKSEIDNLVHTLLHSPSMEVQKRIILILSSMDKAVLHQLIECFPKLSHPIQNDLITTLATTEHVDAYRFLITLLEKENQEQRRLILITVLAKTHYFVFPLLLDALRTAKGGFLESIKAIFKEMGLLRLKPYLKLFSVIPFEWVFRDVFGDNAITKLYKPG